VKDLLEYFTNPESRMFHLGYGIRSFGTRHSSSPYSIQYGYNKLQERKL